jgi:hypothetical protein
MRPDPWPRLPLAEWQDTYETLHRWLQIVGKTRLALAPARNHWWHASLYLTARGLTTSAMPHDGRLVDIELDFIDHVLVARTSEGATRTMPLRAMTVADFHRDYLALLGSLGVVPRIWPVPNELPDALPFPDDRIHRSYDPDAAHRCWRILAQSDRVLKRFQSDFVGKCSPSHFWWGAFDLACTRFSGRPGPRHPGGIPNLPDEVAHEAYSHECISAGWWPGSAAMGVAEPAYYAYIYPEPPGCPDAPVRPAAARWHAGLHEWILPYEAVRTASDPDAELMAFLQSSYEAAARLGGWDLAALAARASV